MKNYNTILKEKQQKISTLLSGYIDKYEYLTGEEQAKFTYFPLSKALEKQIKTIEKQGKKQVEASEILKFINQKLIIKDAIPENTLTEETKNEFNKIKEIEKTVNGENLYYKAINIQIISIFFEQ